MTDISTVSASVPGLEALLNNKALRLERVEAVAQESVAGDPLAEANIMSVLAPGGSYMRRLPVYVDAEHARPSTRKNVEEYFAQATQRYLSVCLAELHGAAVVGQGAVISSKGRLLRNSVAEFVAHGLTPDGFERTGDDTYAVKPGKMRHITEPCILAKRPWYNNFGHWLVDGASLLALAENDIKSEGLSIVIGKYLSPKVREVVLESIERIAPGATVLEQPDDEIWLFDRLCYVTPPHVPPLFKAPEGIRRLRATFLQGIPPATSPRRLYISRNHAASRRLSNEDEIFAICQHHGFELVEPENLAFDEQVKLFAQAEALVGVKGAAFTNVMFCPPSAKILLLSPADFPDPFFWDIAGQLGCEYSESFGTLTTSKQQGLNDFTIAPAQMLHMLAVAGL